MKEQVSTFLLNGKCYGVAASDVQEIVPKVAITDVPLAPEHILGLINLRGQFATVVSLSRMFGLEDSQNAMNVVCRSGDTTLAFSCDEVGDVIEIERDKLLPAPGTVPRAIGSFLSGIYRTENSVYGIINIHKVIEHLVSATHAVAVSVINANSHTIRKVSN
jgi:purine-binding chemotaxis protein CheW